MATTPETSPPLRCLTTPRGGFPTLVPSDRVARTEATARVGRSVLTAPRRVQGELAYIDAAWWSSM